MARKIRDIRNISPARIAYNTLCIVCGRLEEEYIIIGALPVCYNCYYDNFEAVDLDIASENYSIYLNKYLGEDK